MNRNYFREELQVQKWFLRSFEFKRAISISLNHFAGQFDQNEEKKQELIFDSVKSLYKAPNKNLDLASLNKKEMIKLVKCISKIIEKQGFNIPLFSKD